jgi:acyl carrier protein
MSKVLGRVKKLVAKKLCTDESKLNVKASFIELGASSLEITDLLIGIEDEFGIRIPDHDTDRLTSISGVAKYVQKRMAA